MKKVISYIIVFAFFIITFAGCAGESMEAGTQFHTNAESSIPETTVHSPVVIDVFPSRILVVGDTLRLSDNSDVFVQGSIINSNMSSDGVQDRFQQTIERLGILPSCGKICLVFADESPLSVTLKEMNILGDNQGNEPKVIHRPKGMVEFYLPQSLDFALISDLGNIPDRYFQIICQYPDRVVEYLLVTKALMN